MRGAGGCGRGASQLATAKRRLLQAASVGGLTLTGGLVLSGRGHRAGGGDAARGDRHGPAPAADPAGDPRCRARPCGSIPASLGPHSPASLQVVATTPVTGLGVDRDKVTAIVQTLPAEDFLRVYSPNVTQSVFISDVQGNEFSSDLRYRGFTASPLQGRPQGLAVYMQGIRVNEAFCERRRQFFRCDRTDAHRAPRQRLPGDLHVAADHAERSPAPGA